MRFSAPRSVAAGTVVLLLLLRVPLLFQSLWWDEAYTVQVYGQDPGSTRDADAYLPNNHVLFSYLAWLVRSLAGPSPLALRLVPYLATVAGILAVGALVRRHLGSDAALVALLLLAASPTVLELSVQARGYGLGFGAMGFALLATDQLLERRRLADEAMRPPASRPGWAVVLALATFVGVATLPQFVLAAVGIGVVVVLDRRGRRPGAAAMAATGVASLLLYRTLVSDILAQTDRVGTRLAETATVGDLVVIPAIGAVAAVLGDRPTGALRVLAVVAGLGLLLVGAWRWASEAWRRTALLAAPVAVTAAGIVVLGASTLPRYTSFLLLPLAALVAGAVAYLPGPSARGGVAMLGILLLLVGAYRIGDHLRRPQEEVGRVVDVAIERGVERLYVNRRPGHVTFHAASDRRGVDLPVVVATEVAPDQLCEEVAAGVAAFVDYPFERDDLPGEVPDCLGRPDLVLDQRLAPGRIALHVGGG